MMVRWHAYDLKILHISKSALQTIISHLKEIYGNNLKENFGHQHDYLGMCFDYSTKGEVQVSMDKSIATIIDTFPEQITGVSATPVNDNLFKVRPDGEKRLPESQATMFHHTSAQLLSISNCIRCDIQTTVTFLTTRVQHPDEEDWGKLK